MPRYIVHRNGRVLGPICLLVKFHRGNKAKIYEKLIKIVIFFRTYYPFISKRAIKTKSNQFQTMKKLSGNISRVISTVLDSSLFCQRFPQFDDFFKISTFS